MLPWIVIALVSLLGAASPTLGAWHGVAWSDNTSTGEYVFISVTNLGSASVTVTVEFRDLTGAAVASQAKVIGGGATAQWSSANGNSNQVTGAINSTGSIKVSGTTPDSNLLVVGWQVVPNATNGLADAMSSLAWVSR